MVRCYGRLYSDYIAEYLATMYSVSSQCSTVWHASVPPVWHASVRPVWHASVRLVFIHPDARRANKIRHWSLVVHARPNCVYTQSHQRPGVSPVPQCLNKLGEQCYFGWR